MADRPSSGPRADLRTAQVADALDAMGLADQTLGPSIRAMTTDAVVVGRVVTARAVPARVPEAEGVADSLDPYAGLKDVLGRLGPGDILVLATDRADGYAAWGELCSIAAGTAGSVGIVTDGLVRDLDQTRRLGFPVFACGTSPRDIAGRGALVDFEAPLVIDGVGIETGDLVVADLDGVVIVPRARIDDVVAGAHIRGDDERAFHDAVADGTPIWEAFARTHVL